MTIKSVRQVDNLSENLQKKINLNSMTGMNGSHIPEATPKHDRADCELVYENKNNASIRLGRDRPGNKLSGYGGAGHTACGSIDLVAGSRPPGSSGPEGNKYSNPDMTHDAARVYISQKSDVDRNFNLAPGVFGESTGQSTFAAKADSVRMAARLGIKLVTGMDTHDSQGIPLHGVRGIDLIAGNNHGTYRPVGFDEDISMIQPIPKGDNLVKYLKGLSEKVDQLSSILDNFIGIQAMFNSMTANHFHPTVPPTPVSPGAALPSPPLQAGLPSVSMMSANFVKGPNYTNRINISTLNSNYLSNEGPLYINSRHNRTN